MWGLWPAAMVPMLVLLAPFAATRGSSSSSSSGGGGGGAHRPPPWVPPKGFPSNPCPCGALCRPLDALQNDERGPFPAAPARKEFFGFHATQIYNGTPDSYEHWDWDALTTVAVWSVWDIPGANWSLLCTAHAHGVKVRVLAVLLAVRVRASCSALAMLPSMLPSVLPSVLPSAFPAVLPAVLLTVSPAVRWPLLCTTRAHAAHTPRTRRAAPRSCCPFEAAPTSTGRRS